MPQIEENEDAFVEEDSEQNIEFTDTTDTAEMMLYNGSRVIDKDLNSQDIYISENLNLKSITDLKKSAKNEMSLTDDVNHAPVAGLQYAVLNPDSLVNGEFTTETQLAFFWKWDNTLYTYDIDEGDTITAYIGGVPLENCYSLGGADEDYEGFAVLNLTPGDYELFFYVVDNHGAKSNVTSLAFSIVDVTEQPSDDVLVFEDSLASETDVKTYTIPVDFTKTPEVDFCLIRTGASGLKMTIFDEAGNEVRNAACAPDVPGFQTYAGEKTRSAVRVKQTDNVASQTYTVKIENNKVFKEGDSDFKLMMCSSDDAGILMGGKENVTHIYPNIYDPEKDSKVYIQQYLPSTNPEQGHWYSFAGDGKMVFTISQSQIKNSALRFQIRDVDGRVLYDSNKDPNAIRKVETLPNGIVTDYIEKLTCETEFGQKYYLVVYSSQEQSYSHEYAYSVCIGDPQYVSAKVDFVFENVSLKKGAETTVKATVSDNIPDSIIANYVVYSHGDIAALENYWYCRHGSSSWTPVYLYREGKFKVDWKNDSSTKVKGDWFFKFKSKKDTVDDITITLYYLYEKGNQFII